MWELHCPMDPKQTGPSAPGGGPPSSARGPLLQTQENTDARKLRNDINSKIYKTEGHERNHLKENQQDSNDPSALTAGSSQSLAWHQPLRGGMVTPGIELGWFLPTTVPPCSRDCQGAPSVLQRVESVPGAQESVAWEAPEEKTPSRGPVLVGSLTEPHHPVGPSVTYRFFGV